MASGSMKKGRKKDSKEGEKEVEVQKKRRKISRVWEHFELKKWKNMVQCLHCKRKLTYKNSTTPMLMHLKRKHPAHIKSKQPEPRMKRLQASPGSPGGSEKRMTFSQSEVQALIEKEVCNAVKKSETILEGLSETFQQLDRAINNETTIRQLEARINRVTQRAEAALMYMTEKKIPVVSLSDVDSIRLHADEAAVVTAQNKNTKSKENSGELLEIMEITKKSLDKMRHDNKALMAAIEDRKAEEVPTVVSCHSSSNSKKTNLKSLNDKETSKSSEDRVKDCASPNDASGQTKALYPSLPSTVFPSILDSKAASFNIPQKPVVRLALIRNPANLSVLWDVEEVDPFAPPMDSYSILITMEKAKGSGVFSKWSTVGEVTAIPLPVCVMISNYKPGHKVCVAVVGKDKFGRYGPYSNVATATIPD